MRRDVVRGRVRRGVGVVSVRRIISFAKGTAFEEFSALSMQDARKGEFDLSGANLECLNKLQDAKDFDPRTQALTTPKPMSGLEGASGAWRETLHRVLIQWMSCRWLRAELALYRVRQGAQ